jgi:hypothetical protein
MRGRPPLRRKRRGVWGVAGGVGLAALWVLRNIDWGPFAWLGSGAAGSGT